MGLMDFIKRAEPNPTNNEQSLLSALTGETTMSWENAMQVPAFASCVNLIANTISMIPIKLYSRTADGVEEVEDDIRPYLLNIDSKDTLTASQMKRAVIMDYFNKGGYIYINSKRNTVDSLHYVDAGYVSVMSNSDPIFKSYNLSVNGKQYPMFKFIKVLRNTQNGWTSKSIVEENKEILTTAYEAILLEQSLNKTGGEPNGFILSEKQLTDDAIKALKTAWNSRYSSNREKENVVILNNGLKFQASSATSVELQLNENKKVNSREICNIFNVPEGMINGHPTEQDKIMFIQFCIKPILSEIEASLDRDLLLEREKRDYFFESDTTELLKADIEKRFNAYEKGLKNGFMQIDEIREKENLEPLGLDFVKLGLSDVLYNPETKEIYTPNTGVGTKLDELNTTNEEGESNGTDSGTDDGNITGNS